MRLLMFVPALYIAAAFGPYIAPSMGLRFEHLAGYGMLPVAFTLAAYRRGQNYRTFMLIALALIGIVMAALVASVTVSSGNQKLTALAILSHADNFLLPASVFIGLPVVLSQLPPAELENAERLALQVLFWLMAINAFVILIEFNRPPFVQTLRVFHSGSFYHNENAGLAAENGRFTGIFNQPAELGYSASIAFLGLIYYFSKYRRRTSGMVYLIWFVGIMLNGVGPASKIFIVFGTLSVLLYIHFYYGPARSVPLVLGTLITGTTAGLTLTDVRLPGLEQLQRLLSDAGTSGTLAAVTGNRYDTGSQLLVQFQSVTEKSPILGLGLDPFSPLDSAYIESYAQAGLIGVCLLLAVFGLIWFFTLGKPFSERARVYLVRTLLLLTIGASLGVPTLTQNRGGLIASCLLVTAMMSLRASLVASRASLNKGGAPGRLAPPGLDYQHQG